MLCAAQQCIMSKSVSAPPGVTWNGLGGPTVGRWFQGLCDGGMGACRCLNCDVSESRESDGNCSFRLAEFYLAFAYV